MLTSVLAWVASVAVAQPTWRVAPIDLEGPSPRVGSLVPVSEVLGAELFGVLVLSPDRASRFLFERWLEDGGARARTPLVVVRRIDVPRLPRWIPETEGARVWMIDADPFVGLPKAPGAVMMCTPRGCAPAAASGTFERLPSLELFGAAGRSLDEWRDALLDDPGLGRRLVRKLPKDGRATVAAMPGPQRLEALSISATLHGASAANLVPWVKATRFDAECRIRSATDCLAYGRELRERGAREEAQAVLRHACERGATEACAEVAPSSAAPRAANRIEAGARAAPPEGLPADFDPAWWPTDPAWRVPYRKATQLSTMHRGRLPSYPVRKRDRISTVCFAMILVGTDGLPADVRVEGCPEVYAAEAARAVRTWRWAPPATSTSTVVVVRFKLP